MSVPSVSMAAPSLTAQHKVNRNNLISTAGQKTAALTRKVMRDDDLLVEEATGRQLGGSDGSGAAMEQKFHTEL